MRECGNAEGIVAGIMAGCVVWRLDRSHDHAGRVIMPVGALPRSAHETAPAVQAGDCVRHLKAAAMQRLQADDDGPRSARLTCRARGLRRLLETVPSRRTLSAETCA